MLSVRQMLCSSRSVVRTNLLRIDNRLKSQVPNVARPPGINRRLENPGMRQANQDNSGGRAWFLLIIPVSAFWLGCWQVKRKKWKEDLIQQLDIKTKEPAVPLPHEPSELQDLEYRKVFVKGSFDHTQELYLGPRTCLVEGESTYDGKLMSTRANTSSGYNVITPFVVSDTGERILVNRGWVPFSKKNASTRPEGQIKEEIELEGVVRLGEPRPQFTPPNKSDVNIWFHRDVEGMAALTDCSPVFLDASANSTVAGGPIGGQTRATLRNEHMSYILTWFSLSAATSYMWYMKYMRKTW